METFFAEHTKGQKQKLPYKVSFGQATNLLRKILGEVSLLLKRRGVFKKRELVTNTVKCKELNPFGVYEFRVIRGKSQIMARNSSNTQVWNKC